MDKEAGEPLPGAHVMLRNQSKGDVTNAEGKFKITLRKGEYALVSSFVGYRSDTLFLKIRQDTSISIDLQAASIRSEKVVFTGNRDRNIQSTMPGMVKLTSKELKEIPTVLGVQDPIKYLKLTPGVQSAEGGNRGIFVRGGGADQNLILLDKTPLYNPSHLGGMFSIFMPETIRNFEVIKGSLPAYYGGRLASVISLNTKKGDKREMNYKGNIGLLSSSFSIDGPLKENKSSFLIGARRTYYDLLMQPFTDMMDSFSPMHSATFYHFYDTYGKINYRISSNDQLTLSGYFGRDSYDFSKEYINLESSMLWGNSAASLKWDHIWNKHFFMNTSLHYTDYKFDFSANQSIYNFSMHTNIKDWIYKINFTYLPWGDDINLKFGLEHIYHHFQPNKQKVQAEQTKINIADISDLYSHETAAYVNANIRVTDQIRINTGLRYTHFLHTGPYEELSKDRFGKISDTIRYNKFEAIKPGYNRLEPRISTRFLISPSTSLKFAFNKGIQYVHIVPVTSVSLPTDIWIPSTYQIPPQTGKQFSGGIFRNFTADKWETSLNAYYKTMKNQLKFARGLVNPQVVSLSERLVKGRAISYGLEAFIKKNTGQWTGWMSYTLSKTTKQFDALNNGQPFPAKYDRRHDFTFTTTYKLNKRWSFSGVFSYSSGNRMTIPVARYLIQRSIINEYGEINGYQMPPYHHLDLSATYRVKKKNWNSSWNFSIYNLYNRANPYYIYFDTKEDVQNYKLDVNPKMVTLFPVLPSVSWSIKF